MVALDYIVCRSLPFVSPFCRVRLQLSLLSDTNYSEARIISFFEFLVKITVRKLVNVDSFYTSCFYFISWIISFVALFHSLCFTFFLCSSAVVVAFDTRYWESICSNLLWKLVRKLINVDSRSSHSFYTLCFHFISWIISFVFSSFCFILCSFAVVVDIRYEAKIVSLFEFLVKITVRKLVNIDSFYTSCFHFISWIISFVAFFSSFCFILCSSAVVVALWYQVLWNENSQFVRISCENYSQKISQRRFSFLAFFLHVFILLVALD